jgi:hypothetical protein
MSVHFAFDHQPPASAHDINILVKSSSFFFTCTAVSECLGCGTGHLAPSVATGFERTSQSWQRFSGVSRS